jgi:uncharacterized integral membrane protein
MKKETKQNIILWFVLLALLLLLFGSCKTNTVYVPVETMKTEYKDRFFRDSVRLYDSIFVKMANDTVWMEKYKYLYRDRLVRDSVFVSDSIQVPYPVVEYREVNRLSSFQSFQIWCGRILLIVLFIFIVYKIFRRRII